MDKNLLIIKINGTKFAVPKAYKTLFQSLSYLYFKVPHFCYNTKLFISGNCRMCLVEVLNLPKPIISCAFPINPGLEIYTNSPLVFKGRENISEFLLNNHPIDCPVCDQGGECDLQEVTFNHGSSSSRFFFQKGTKSATRFSKIIQTSMNKCINCTKCVRLGYFLGQNTLGLFSRSSTSSIKYLSKKKKVLALQNNLVAICPVALPLMELLTIAKTFYFLQTSSVFLLSQETQLIALLIQKQNIISEFHVVQPTSGDFKMLYNLFSESNREFLEQPKREVEAIVEYCIVFKTRTYSLGFNEPLYLVKVLIQNSFVFRDIDLYDI